jgi:hypothetical protein
MNSLNFQDLMSSYSSYNKQIQFIRKHIRVFDPFEYKLGERIENRPQKRFHSLVHSRIQKRRTISQIIDETFQYIPITGTLKTVLNKPILKEMIDNERIVPSSIFEAFVDGQTFRNHVFLNKYPHTIRLNLYYDECKPVDKQDG